MQIWFITIDKKSKGVYLSEVLTISKELIKTPVSIFFSGYFVINDTQSFINPQFWTIS